MTSVINDRVSLKSYLFGQPNEKLFESTNKIMLDWISFYRSSMFLTLLRQLIWVHSANVINLSRAFEEDKRRNWSDSVFFCSNGALESKNKRSKRHELLKPYQCQLSRKLGKDIALKAHRTLGPFDDMERTSSLWSRRRICDWRPKYGRKRSPRRSLLLGSFCKSQLFRLFETFETTNFYYSWFWKTRTRRRIFEY